MSVFKCTLLFLTGVCMVIIIALAVVLIMAALCGITEHINDIVQDWKIERRRPRK